MHCIKLNIPCSGFIVTTSPIIRRQVKSFDITNLNINPLMVFPYVPCSSSSEGGVYFECVSLLSFNDSEITIEYDYAGQLNIGIEAVAYILGYKKI